MKWRIANLSFVVAFLLSPALGLAQELSSIGEERAFEYVAPWPPWLTIVILLATSIAIYGLYLREETDWAAWTKWLLATIRLSLVCLVLWMMYGFTERPFRTDLPDLLVFVDDSPSMQTVDAIQNERLKSQIATDVAALELPDTSRLSQAKAVLLRNDAAVLQFLQSNYQVKLLGLDSVSDETPESDLVSRIRALESNGDQSRLGAALRQGLQQRRGRPVASVLFLSDGITTDGPLLSEVAREAKQREIPLHVVGLGSRLPARDLQLSDLLVNDVVFVGDIVTFDFKLSASGYENQSIEVVLRRADGAGKSIRKSVEISELQESKSTRLVFKAKEKGEFEFIIEVPPREGEVSDENNQLTAQVEVRDEKTRVLLVQSYPNFEFHYLKTLLQRASESSPEGNGSVDLSVVLQDADPRFADIDTTALPSFPSREELFEYDVCIFGDVNPGYLSSKSLQDLRDFVVERGRGFIGVAGPRYFPTAYAGTPLAEIIPFEIRNALSPPADLPIDTGYQPRLTSLGQRMPAMQLSSDATENSLRWSELPELYWLLEVDALRMGTRTLAEHPTRTGTSDQSLPVVTLSYAGAGKVLFHCTDDSWRWRIGRGDEFFGRYWQQSIRYLSRFKLGEDETLNLPATGKLTNAERPCVCALAFLMIELHLAKTAEL